MSRNNVRDSSSELAIRVKATEATTGLMKVDSGTSGYNTATRPRCYAHLSEIVFPPMRELVRLDYNVLEEGQGSIKHEHAGRASMGNVIVHFSLITQYIVSTSLLEVRLDHLKQVQQQYFNQLTEAISKLTSLRKLELQFYSPEKRICSRIVPQLFVALPSSIQSLMLRVCTAGQLNLKDPSISDIEILDPAYYQQQNPLLKLREWVVRTDFPMSLGVLTSIFTLCPALETMMVPIVMHPDDEQTAAEFLVEKCPKVRRLLQLDDGVIMTNIVDSDADSEDEEDDTVQCNGVILKMASQAMPKDYMESFCYDGFFEGRLQFQRTLMLYLCPHVGSLKEVRLTNCRSLASSSIGQLLCFARVLEVLVVEGPEEIDGDYNTDLEYFAVTVQDLGSISWATSRLKEFRLRIYADKNQIHYPDLPSSEIMTTMAYLNPFEDFLNNLGRQIDLRVVELKLETSIDGGDYEPYHMECIPAFLSLDDGLGSNPFRGYLGHLCGLSKLEELRGSFNLNPQNLSGYSIGMAEAMWMKEHWPRLKVAEFYPKTGDQNSCDPSPPFQWLKEQLPGLVYSCI
ncbi:hypothetical protein FBU30_000999 [Linnemannia zychae]|nr:hypothetical protein FBU30_000999 [Linnemannia zychae]